MLALVLFKEMKVRRRADETVGELDNPSQNQILKHLIVKWLCSTLIDLPGKPGLYTYILVQDLITTWTGL